MIKKLTAKTQELNPRLPQYSNSFSKCIVIKPDSPNLLLKKGTVYTIFEISGSSNFDTELITKVVNDVIYESYYESEIISPIQSMEKSIMETKDKILHLSNDTLTSDPQDINLNVLSAILWGNVLYIVKFGSAKSYLVKSNGIVSLEMVSEGNFSSSSKIVDEDEVLILCTDNFDKVFPAEKLLSSSISENDLDTNQSCLLMRLLIDTSFSKDEEIDFGLGEVASKSQAREKGQKIVGKIKNFFEKLLIVGKKIGSLALSLGLVIIRMFPKRKAALLKRKITQISSEGLGGREKSKTKGWVFLSLIAVLLAVSVFFTFRSVVFKDNKDEKGEEKTAEQLEKSENNTTESQMVNLEDRTKDEQYKIKRVSPEIFYDLKIAEENSNPSEIQIVGEKIVAVDRTSGRIFVSEISTPNFSMETNTFPGIKSLAQVNSLLSFNDKEGYKTYNLEDSQTKDSYKVEGINLSFPYADFIYSVSDDILTRSSEKDGELSSTVWGQNPDFNNAVSMSIAYSIYVLKSDGNLVNFSGGSRTDFSVTGLEKSFLEPTKVTADIDFDYIYVADKGNKSIVVLDNKGNLVRQYKNDKDGEWDDIRSISVTSDEKVIFVLNSSKIYKLNVE